MSKVPFTLSTSETSKIQMDPIPSPESNTITTKGLLLAPSLGIGTGLSWYSMHSRYIISNNSGMKFNNGYTVELGSNTSVRPKNNATIFSFTSPPQQSITTNNIMIWLPTESSTEDQNSLDGSYDDIIWNGTYTSGIKPTISLYESSYISIDTLLKTKSENFKVATNNINTNTSTITKLQDSIDCLLYTSPSPRD